MNSPQRGNEKSQIYEGGSSENNELSLALKLQARRKLRLED